MKQDASRYLLGLLLIILGVFFVFKNFNIPFFSQINIFQFLIPLLLLYWAYQSYLKGKQVAALILGLVGISTLFDSIGLKFLGFGLLEKLMVPGIFILIGYSIINRNPSSTASAQKDQYVSPEHQNKTYYSPGAEIDEAPLDARANPSNPTADADSKTQNNTQKTQGTLKKRQLTTVFSSQRLVYSKSDFESGNSYIDATCVFGDLDLVFSKDINLHIDANVTMADLDFIGHKYGGIMNKFQETYKAEGSDVHVYITLSVVFGDVDIIHFH